MFSASNYYEIGSNKGSYIKFGANSDRYFVQFTAAASKTKKLTFRQQVDNVEKSAIKELKEKLREQKVQLQKEFDKRDPENTGAILRRFEIFPFLMFDINRSNVAEPMVGSDGSCHQLQAAMAVAAREAGSGQRKQRNHVHANALHDRMRRNRKLNNFGVVELLGQQVIDSHFHKQKIGANGTENLVDTMYTNRENLEAIFRMMDLDSNGLISIDEFKQACELLSGTMKTLIEAGLFK